MDIIFLDIDGVLNVPFAYANNKKYNYDNSMYPNIGFYSNSVSNLNELIYYTGARIVVTSTWRTKCSFKKLVEELRIRGIYTGVYDVTEALNTSRGEEIAEWLQRHEDVKNFIIIDDNIKDIKNLFPNVSMESDKFRGFTANLLEKSLDILLTNEFKH